MADIYLGCCTRPSSWIHDQYITRHMHWQIPTMNFSRYSTWKHYCFHEAWHVRLLSELRVGLAYSPFMFHLTDNAQMLLVSVIGGGSARVISSHPCWNVISYYHHGKVNVRKRLLPLASNHVALALKNVAMCKLCNNFDGRKNLWVYLYTYTFYKFPACVRANEISFSKIGPTHGTEWSHLCFQWKLDAMGRHDPKCTSEFSFALHHKTFCNCHRTESRVLPLMHLSIWSPSPPPGIYRARVDDDQ